MKIIPFILILFMALPCYAHKPPSLEQDIPYGGYGLGGEGDYWASVWLGTVVVGGLITMAVLYNLNKEDEKDDTRWFAQVGYSDDYDRDSRHLFCRLVFRF